MLQDRTGLGTKGESYLVGRDGGTVRYKSNRTVGKGRFDQPVKASWIKTALSGKSGQMFATSGHRGYHMVSYSPLTLPGGLKWTLVTTMAADHVIASTAGGKKTDLVAQYKSKYGYENVFLVGPDGYVFHSAKHGADQYTNLVSGPLKSTNLGQLVTRVIKTKSHGMADFKRYKPSFNVPSAFIAQPVVSGKQLELVVAAQLSLNQINAVTRERTGLGHTGETYLVGTDKMWRNDSFYLQELDVFSTVLNPEAKVDTQASRSALTGGSDTQIIDNYRGVPVLSSWQSLTILKPTPANPKGVKWAMIAEIAKEEIERPVIQMAWLSAAILGGAVLLVTLMAFLTAGGLTRQIRGINELFGKIGMGDFNARARVASQDEIGTMATSLNAMLDNTLSLIQSREERDEIQNSTMKLLEEITALTEGDLTARAEVTEAVTGAIADSFNEMAQQLSNVVKDVKETTLQVGGTSEEVSTATTKLADTSARQAKQVADAVKGINQMATSIRRVAQHALRSAEVSEQSTRNAKEGAVAVRNTSAAMAGIRENVQETARAIKRLGESSQEIGNIVQIINEIADRTSILALNASIQAAMAGDAGRGFAVVAEEVQRLAERSTNSTKQIETLVKNIQGEITEAGSKMDESIQRVVDGSKLAEDAHGKLEEIEAVSAQLAQLVQSISSAANQQSKASEVITKTMEEVGRTSAEASVESRQTAESVGKMAQVAKRLQVSVETFKLDGDGRPKAKTEAAPEPEAARDPEAKEKPEVFPDDIYIQSDDGDEAPAADPVSTLH